MEFDHFKERRMAVTREGAFRYVMSFAILISAISLSSLCITISLSISYINEFNQRFRKDSTYCHVSENFQ